MQRLDIKNKLVAALVKAAIFELLCTNMFIRRKFIPTDTLASHVFTEPVREVHLE